MISFAQLKTQVKQSVFTAVREDTDVYFEAVISRADLGGLVLSLEKEFGPALFPSGNRLTSDIQKVIEDFGGVMKGQTLYFCRQENSSVFAMLWPWQDGQNVTLKLGIK